MFTSNHHSAAMKTENALAVVSGEWRLQSGADTWLQFIADAARQEIQDEKTCIFEME
jgi:hypothetical protein